MATVDQRSTGMSPETARFILHIFKWLGISLGLGTLALGPPASWIIIALAHASRYPWVVFVIFYGLYAIAGFISFLCYLDDRADGNRSARSGYLAYVIPSRRSS